ncbi:type II toxin-antitoxin system RelE/ParE family toxin [Olsenella uli]|uniref:type II toxin-antitoxin system RelE/ParE family toxin n=1 Tax=Olsenella uli TaxID=133926 RepID=UPI00195D29D2|nr:type II toxin-antitoxin system RelE/ParE family toxin [Olsenella uli]MBM6676135.1 type II toxin-antitoxin system RelE/ParE family toxin [Olsenella uli]
MYEAIFFERENGEAPVQEFLGGLPIKLREKALRSRILLQELDSKLRGEEKAYVRDGLFELRTKFGSDITRAFYFFFVGQRVVVTSGFVKKSPKPPQREIERALRYKRAWEEAHREDA